jgi:hypothetical protein
MGKAVNADGPIVLNQTRAMPLRLSFWGAVLIVAGLLPQSHRYTIDFIPAVLVLQAVGFLSLGLGLLLLVRPCRLVLAQSGIEFTHMFATSRIPWDAIQNISILSLSRRSLLSQEQTRLTKRMGVNLKLRSGKTLYLSNSWPCTNQELAELIAQCRGRWGSARA